MNHRFYSLMVAAGETTESLAEKVGVDPKTAARWVNPGRIPQTRHRARVAELVRGDIEDLWPDVLRRRDPIWLRAWIEHEREARLVRWFEPNLVMGILQTEAYARAVIGWGGLFDPDEVEELVGSRMERRAIVTSRRPPQLYAMLDEGVLRRCVGGPEVMAEQCAHLVECAALQHVHIQIVPFAAGGHVGLAGGFILAKAPHGEAAHLDNRLRAHVADQQEDLDTLETHWEALRAEALPQAQSLKLIKEAVTTWQQT